MDDLREGMEPILIISSLGDEAARIVRQCLKGRHLIPGTTRFVQAEMLVKAHADMKRLISRRVRENERERAGRSGGKAGDSGAKW